MWISVDIIYWTPMGRVHLVDELEVSIWNWKTSLEKDSKSIIGSRSYADSVSKRSSNRNEPHSARHTIRNSISLNSKALNIEVLFVELSNDSNRTIHLIVSNAFNRTVLILADDLTNLHIGGSASPYTKPWRSSERTACEVSPCWPNTVSYSSMMIRFVQEYS